METTDAARPLVVTTWRVHPEPTGVLAEVAEALARMHATRIELTGLPAHDSAVVFEAVTHRELSVTEADALRERTDGNPFFLVELARLAGDRTGVPERDELPTAVTDVLNRRLLRLPETTVTAPRTASVIGRDFDTSTLAAVTGIDEDDLLDVVEPAQAAGLIREDGVDHYFFAHALVRDTLRTGMSASRRARAHARAAEALSGMPGRETEVAWHWLGAGPSYADRAWRAAVDAASLARRWRVACTPTTRRSRCSRARSCRCRATPPRACATGTTCSWGSWRPTAGRPCCPTWCGWSRSRSRSASSCATPRRSPGPRSPPRRARSGTPHPPGRSTTWSCRPCEEASTDCLRTTASCGVARCSRSPTSCSRWPPCRSAPRWWRRASRWRAGSAIPPCSWRRTRSRSSRSGCRRRPPSGCARSTRRCASRPRSATSGPTSCPRRCGPWSSTSSGGPARCGRPSRSPGARRVGCGSRSPRWSWPGSSCHGWRWRAASTSATGCSTRSRRCTAGCRSDADEALAGAMLAVRLWQGRAAEVVPLLESLNESQSFSAPVAVYLWRAGERDRARAYFAERGAALDGNGDTELFSWCTAAEIALHVGGRATAADAYELAAPFAGWCATAGSGLAIGPVDAFLAMAAATGETALATRHADDALALAEVWEVPLVADWIREQRATYGY